MKFLYAIAVLAIAFALAPNAAARASAGRGRQAEEREAGQQRGRQAAEPSSERSVAAASSVAVSLCVASGDVVVRGWDRAEVRARTSDSGSLRLVTPNVQPAPSVQVLVSERGEGETPGDDCGSTGTLEVSVPRGATVNVETRDGHVEVADVASARVHALSGDVDVRRVSRSVEVSCLSGDISLSDSSGPAEISTVSGNVEARNVRATSSGDGFEAKSTSGDVSIEGVTHAQVRGTSVSGGISYVGALARGGDYDFKSISGDVTLELPADSSFSLHAKVLMSGDILTDFPVKTSAGPASPNGAGVTPPPPPDWRQKPGKNKFPKEPTGTRLDGTVGTGDAVVNLSSFSGSLYLRKR